MREERTINYYTVLEIAPTATNADIKKAWHEQMQVWHPDRFSHSPALHRKAETRAKLINQAYQTLSDPAARARYDAACGSWRVAEPLAAFLYFRHHQVFFCWYQILTLFQRLAREADLSRDHLVASSPDSLWWILGVNLAAEGGLVPEHLQGEGGVSEGGGVGGGHGADCRPVARRVQLAPTA